jgi:UDP-N-acetylglucosamine 4,6-dehydratase/UDP-glucose 4-epimerase
MLKVGKKYLVTGGSGFLGETLVKRLLQQNVKVRVMARDEGKLIMLKEKFPDVEIYTGDISDPFEVAQACVGIQGIFHLAASKHVGLAEKFTRECVKTNIVGSMHILEQSLKQEFDFVIAISTDKAAQVSGVYGGSKLIMEKLVQQYESLNPRTQYRIVRYGNVLYSTGSVLCKWKDLLKANKEIVVTEPEATRFFWTVDEAVDLIFECMDKAKDSSPFVPDMKSMKVKDLLEAMVQKYYSHDKAELKIKSIGLQLGENLHEKILEKGPYSNEVEFFSIDEIKEKI